MLSSQNTQLNKSRKSRIRMMLTAQLGFVMMTFLFWFTDAIAEINDELIQAAKANNAEKVYQLVNEGASVRTTRKGTSVLMYSCQNKNYELARWLIERGADIDSVSILTSDTDNHLVGYSNAQREFMSFLVNKKLVKMGLKLPGSADTEQVVFVERVKESIISWLKENGPWPKDAIGWSIRLVDVGRGSSYGEISVECDVAAWNEVAMYELISKTGAIQNPPPLKNDVSLTHAWVVDKGQMLSTNYDKNRVPNGDFIIAINSRNEFVASHVVH